MDLLWSRLIVRGCRSSVVRYFELIVCRSLNLRRDWIVFSKLFSVWRWLTVDSWRLTIHAYRIGKYHPFTATQCQWHLAISDIVHSFHHGYFARLHSLLAHTLPSERLTAGYLCMYLPKWLLSVIFFSGSRHPTVRYWHQTNSRKRLALSNTFSHSFDMTLYYMKASDISNIYHTTVVVSNVIQL